MRKPLDLFAVTAMVVLCILWGFQQIAVKLVAGDIAPLMQMALRCAFAALILLAYVLWKDGLRAFADGTLKAGILVGVLFAVEFMFIGQGLVHTSASHLVVFLYSAPIFAALGLHLRLPDERLSALQWVGVVLAFGGLAFSFLGRGGLGGPEMLLGDLMGVAAGLAWGVTTVAIRVSKLSDAPASKTLLYQVGGSAILLLAAAAIMGETQVVITPASGLSLAFQALVVTLISYVVWFWLLTKYLASRLSILSFLTPMFGVVFGVWLLHEPLDPSFILGGAMVLAGVALVSGAELLTSRRRAAA